jgi:hypothetical protein
MRGFFCKYHQKAVAGTPEIAPQIRGFHTTALDGTEPNIVDFIDFICGMLNSLDAIKHVIGGQ